MTTTTAPLIRPAWTPATIALMILGFMVFWPLGLAMLAYIIWGDRLDTLKRDINTATDNLTGAFKGGAKPAFRTGNYAFDDWRDAEIERLSEERRKLDEMRDEFDAYLRELRRAKDQEEFDAFMKSRQQQSGKKKGKSVPKVSDA